MMAELTHTVGRLMRWVLAICTDANSVGDMIAEIAPEAGEPKETLLLAAKAHELLVLAVGPCCGVGVPGAQEQCSRMILGSWASCSCLA